MNHSLSNIEASLYRSLMNVSCQPLKNITNIEPNITLKDILTNETYLDEKLNLFIWIMFKFEPKFATEFVDYEFNAPEVKCKKIIEGLYSLGLIDPVDFTVGKLLDSNGKYYRITLLVLNELNSILQNKLISQMSNIDDIFSLDLLSSDPQQFQSPTNEAQNYFDEIFYKKIQLFEDPLFMKEYRSIVQSTKQTQSLLPTDLNRMVRSINEQSALDFQYTKSTKIEDLIEFLETQVQNLEPKVDELKQNSSHKNKNISILTEEEQAKTNSIGNIDGDLSKTSNLLKEFNQFVIDVQNSLNSTKATNTNATIFDTDIFGVESNLGKNFYDLAIVNKKLKTISKNFADWSRFIDIQTEKQKNYAESALVNETDMEGIKAEMNEIEMVLLDFLGMLGFPTTIKPTSSSACTAKFPASSLEASSNLSCNQTIVDKLLML